MPRRHFTFRLCEPDSVRIQSRLLSHDGKKERNRNKPASDRKLIALQEVRRLRRLVTSAAARSAAKKGSSFSGTAYVDHAFPYSALGAPTGHTPAQAPHSTQASASIWYFPSPSEIALTGHSPAHAPQLMQSSEIIYAIYMHLRCY